MKQSIYRVSIFLAVFLLLTGGLIMCPCPAWYAGGLAFSGVALWAGWPKHRLWPACVSIACVCLAVVAEHARQRDLERDRLIRERMNAVELSEP